MWINGNNGTEKEKPVILPSFGDGNFIVTPNDPWKVCMLALRTEIEYFLVPVDDLIEPDRLGHGDNTLEGKYFAQADIRLWDILSELVIDWRRVTGDEGALLPITRLYIPFNRYADTEGLELKVPKANVNGDYFGSTELDWVYADPKYSFYNKGMETDLLNDRIDSSDGRGHWAGLAVDFSSVAYKNNEFLTILEKSLKRVHHKWEYDPETKESIEKEAMHFSKNGSYKYLKCTPVEGKDYIYDVLCDWLPSAYARWIWLTFYSTGLRSGFVNNITDYIAYHIRTNGFYPTVFPFYDTTVIDNRKRLNYYQFEKLFRFNFGTELKDEY